jgi:glycosyltransferase involved in cell wall biosynthesis
MIESVKAQTYNSWELLITDDCSTDGSDLIVEQYAKNDPRIRLFRLENNSGPGVARNNSITHAQGRFIAFLDSDDQWKPEKLEKQVKFMIDNDLALSFSSYDVIDEIGNRLYCIKAPVKVTYSKMLRNDYMGFLTTMYDVTKIGKVYMSDLRKRQDWALKLSILHLIPFALSLPESLAIYRRRQVSVSSNKITLLKYNWMVYRNLERFSAIKSFFYMLQFLLFYFLKKI